MSESDKNTQTTNVCDLPGKAIETLGEVFSDGCFLELVHDPADRDAVHLMLFDGESARIAPRVEHNNHVYIAQATDPGIARELYLPAEFRPNESALQLAADITHLVQKYCGLEVEAAELLARFFFANWVADALPAAPSLVIIGPESRELTQLLVLTKCLSRHALVLTEVTASDLRSLPTALGLTLAIDQPEINESLERLLNASRKHVTKVPHRGSLFSPYFSKLIHCTDQFDAWPIKAVKLLVVPSGRAISLLDDQAQARIAKDFQPRMISFRFDNFATVRARTGENSNGESAERAGVGVLPAAAFEDAELHVKILDLVEHSATDDSDDRWIDPTVVLLECLLTSCHLPNQTARYMGQLAEEMMTLLSARGEERKIWPKQVGRMIRELGFKTEPRDKQGVRLILTEAVREKIHKLAYDFGVQSIEKPAPGCPHCEATRKEHG